MKLYTTIITLCMASFAFACDVCGCQLSGLSLGILPSTSTHYIGLSYTHAAFGSTIDYTHSSLQDQYSKDSFITTELFGRYMLSNRIQIHGFIPYKDNAMVGNLENVYANGLGDISVLGYYSLIHTGLTRAKINPKTSHVLLVGAGLKLPTGAFDKTQNGAIVNRNFQLGSGSLDYLLSANYTFSYANFGFNTEMSYKINNQNSDKYQFGNQFNTSISVFYTTKIKNWVLLPSIGTFYEQAQKHTLLGYQQHNTGGNAVFSSLGLQLYKGDFGFKASFLSPVSQKFNADAISSITTKNRYSLGITYSFSATKKAKQKINW